MRKEESKNVVNFNVSNSVKKSFNSWLHIDGDIVAYIERLIVEYFKISNPRLLKKVRSEKQKFYLITDEKKYVIELLSLKDRGELWHNTERYLTITENENTVVYRVRVNTCLDRHYYADFMELTMNVKNYKITVDREACGKIVKDGKLIMEMKYHMTNQGCSRYDIDEIKKFVNFYVQIAQKPESYLHIYKKMSKLFHYLGEYFSINLYRNNVCVKKVDFSNNLLGITIYLNKEENYFFKYNFKEDKIYTIAYSNSEVDIHISYVKKNNEGVYTIMMSGDYNNDNFYSYCTKEFVKSKNDFALWLLEKEKRNY